jgi:hypothetical protein
VLGKKLVHSEEVRANEAKPPFVPNLKRSVVMSADDSALEPILAEALNITQFERGNIQVLDDASGCLTIEAQHGFDESFLERFKIVKADDGCACGRAIRLRHQIFIEDVMSDNEYVPYRQAAVAAGYRSVLSLPLITAAGRLVGVISVHHATPQEPLVEMVRLNNLAEFASGAVARHCYVDQSHSMQQIYDNICVTVEGNAIVVHKPGTTFMVAYEKRPENADLTLIRSWVEPTIASPAVSEFRTRAFQIAVTKARELGWIG